MRFAGFTLALAGIFAGSALGQTPTVGGLLNNYSNTLPGLPNYGIAEGSIFDIYGTNFTSAAAPAPAPPLQPTLNGVSISVTVNGAITHPLFYYLGPTQIDALLPSSTPVGTGTITVTTSAGTSDPFPITPRTTGPGRHKATTPVSIAPIPISCSDIPRQSIRATSWSFGERDWGR